MNAFDDVPVDPRAFAWRDLIGQDKWTPWAPVFGSLTLVGTPVYTGRLRIVGKECQFQVKIVPGTSIASVAGTDYMNLPVSAMGLSGMATMSNDTTNVAVGVCHVDVAASRCYLPSQLASGNTFLIAGSFEV